MGANTGIREVKGGWWDWTVWEVGEGGGGWAAGQGSGRVEVGRDGQGQVGRGGDVWGRRRVRRQWNVFGGGGRKAGWGGQTERVLHSLCFYGRLPGAPRSPYLASHISLPDVSCLAPRFSPHPSWDAPSYARPPSSRCGLAPSP